MKTTFNFNFHFYQTFKQFTQKKTWEQREAVNLKSFYLVASMLVKYKLNSKKAC